ncbi:MAG: 4Fe-4S dicluster domain-containing protein, partial [Halobacteriota archaeon]|nr:4Fe-4S dicluster domain-containing protein [Halobacteriota archaeon]
MKDVSGSVLVIGSGIEGVQVSLDKADQGFKVYLVDNDPSLCIDSPKIDELTKHPNIEVLSYSEVKEIEGESGDFKVKVLRKPRYVDEDLCDGCAQCVEEPGCIKACPVGAIKKDPSTGSIKIDEELCKQEIEANGCKECVTGCEYGAICIPPGYDHAVACDLCGGEPKCVEVCPVNALELKKFHVKLTVDLEKCTGCRSCELACSEEKEGLLSPSRSRIRINEKEGIINYSVCQLCKVDVRCVDSCPENALEKDEETGVIKLVGECIECSACIRACKYDAIKVPPGTNEPIVCDLCGGQPKCMESCPFDAISMEVFYSGIELNPERCTGCRSCELACSEEKDGVFNPKKSRIHIIELNGEIESKKCELCKTCPVYIPIESDDGEMQRKAIYMPPPGAIPYVPTIDRDNCVICGCCDWICK